MRTPNSSPNGTYRDQLRYLTDIELVDRLRGTCGSHEECRKATQPVQDEMVRRFIASARESALAPIDTMVSWPNGALGRNDSGGLTDTPNEGKNIST